MKRTIFLVLVLLLCNIAATINAQSEKVWFAIKDGMDNQNLMSLIETNTTTFLTACNEAIINGKKPNFPSNIIDKNSRKKITDFLDNSPMFSTKEFISEKCSKKAAGGYQVRNIPVNFTTAPDEDKEQEIVINFTSAGLIESITVSVEETRYRAIMEDFSTVEDFGRREIIIDFVENFRTAYNLKDVKQIETVFSDQALIITGNVVKIAPSKDRAINNLLGSEKITYTTYTKKEYIENLKRTFGRNKYIDVQFEDIEVMRHPKNDYLYGVTLKQKWGSSTYNDTGYVFLIIDFKDDQQPMIHVRTWQPDMFNGKPLDKDDIFNLNDFNIQNL
jgi:hypothetical protein